jgi:hypothetical protein
MANDRPERSLISRRAILARGASALTLAAVSGRSPCLADDKEKPALVILDDCDLANPIPGPGGDGVRLLSAGGKTLWSTKGLNNLQTSWGNRGVAIDPRRGRIYIRELIARRVTAFDLAGKVVYRFEDADVSGMAVDPVTGHLWCTGRRGTIVLDAKGGRIARHEQIGVDIDYDLSSRSFWIAGRKVQRVDGDGKPTLKDGPTATWSFASVAAAPMAGGAWVVERSHPQFEGSISQLLFVASDGNVLKRVNRPARSPFGVACETKMSTAWLVDHFRAVIRVPLDGDAVDELDIPAVAVSVGPTSDQIWVTTTKEAIRLDSEGRIIGKFPLGAPSLQSWIAAF